MRTIRTSLIVIGALWLLTLWLGAVLLWGAVAIALSAMLCGAVLVLFGVRGVVSNNPR